jgi:hypothetical protein
VRFFVPGVPDSEAAAVFDRMQKACGASEDTRPSYSIACEDEGTEIVATVAEEGVIAIIFGGASSTFEGPEDWWSVLVESVTEMVFFHDQS